MRARARCVSDVQTQRWSPGACPARLYRATTAWLMGRRFRRPMWWRGMSLKEQRDDLESQDLPRRHLDRRRNALHDGGTGPSGGEAFARSENMRFRLSRG